MHYSAIIFILSLMTAAILFGNILVILSVLIYRKLRKNLTSYLILSLAVADVSVGAFILPFSTVNSVLGVWIFGEIWCRLWLMLDVFMCTASIYNLVAISIDRFFAIVRPMAYPRIITHRKICLMISSAWVVSFLICIPPAFWTNHLIENKTSSQISIHANQSVCTPLHNSPAYVIFSAFGSFYFPMAVIILIYSRIFLAARKVSLSTAKGYVALRLLKCIPPNLDLNDTNEFNAKPRKANNLEIEIMNHSEDVLRIHSGKYSNGELGGGNKISHLLHKNSTKELIVSKEFRNSEVKKSLEEEIKSAPIAASLILFGGITPINSIENPSINTNSAVAKMVGRKTFLRKMKIEIRAAKTVAAITGCFITCWMGFAVIYVLSAFPFCSNSRCVPEWLSGFFIWLGYVNSGLNVIIYALLSKQFRDAFKHILCWIKYN